MKRKQLELFQTAPAADASGGRSVLMQRYISQAMASGCTHLEIITDQRGRTYHHLVLPALVGRKKDANYLDLSLLPVREILKLIQGN